MIKLNLARNCLKYIVRAYGINTIFVPYYSCNSVWKALKEERCQLHFYHIDKNMMPVLPQNLFNKNNFILYINYFGLCHKNCTELAKSYPNLIIDNTQSFYCEHIGLASFNSLRKFFKVQNGAYLHINKTLKDKFTADTLKLTPVLFHENYSKFVQNELLLDNEKKIKLISESVEKQMENIDFESDKNLRKEIYTKYAQIFDKWNELRLHMSKEDIPYCYPLKCYNEKVLNLLNKFTFLSLWQPKDNIIALPLNDIDFVKEILKDFS